MAHKKTKEQISYNMSRVRNKATSLEISLCEALKARGITTFRRNAKEIFGKPDVVFDARQIAIFCDGDFWHGFDWQHQKNDVKSNQSFWLPKIEHNIARDEEVTQKLQDDGWTVLRFWEHEIEKELNYCVSIILDELHDLPHRPYRSIDLCAGIGGIRKGFELTGAFRNVLSAEIDKYACRTYFHLYGENPENDLTSDTFKATVKQTGYDVLLAGFPCQTFSRVGKEEGFENEEKGQIFFHIAKIIEQTRPMVVFLENVDHLVTHDKGKTFATIIDTLVSKQIPFPMNRNNGEELYYSFVVKEWDALDNPVTYCEERVYKARFTNLFLLKNCSQTYELFNIFSEEQYRLLYELKKAYKDATVEEKDSEPLFKVNDQHSVWVHNGCFNLLDQNGNILYRFAVEDFSRRPGATMRKLVDKI